MVNIRVNFTPTLTGIKGEIWVGFLVGGEIVWYYIMDVPPSVDGVMDFGYADGARLSPHRIIFPEQTINGVTYQEARTGDFFTQDDITFNINLTAVEPPPPEIPPTKDILPILAVIGVVVAAALIYKRSKRAT